MGFDSHYICGSNVVSLMKLAFAIVLAMLAWSSELLAAEGDLCAVGSVQNVNGTSMFCDADHHFTPFVTMRSDAYAISGRPPHRDNEPELTATKGDIDALNKRLDHLEMLIRCEGMAARGVDWGRDARCAGP
jgi:hypothetical protein